MIPALKQRARVMTKIIRAAVYLRVSTGDQTVENQRRELQAAAAQRGWTITASYADEGISGAKGRDRRPGLDAMLKDATRGKFDVVMCWAVDRMGRSLADLVGTLQELHGAKVDLFLHQQAIDTTTPAGRAMFGMLGVFAEFERSMIQSRVNAGLARAKAAGVRLGRPKVTAKLEAAIRERLAAGDGIIKAAKAVGVGNGTVQRVKQAMAASG
jgi:DNA invertase Pin-like site-specific DNA recombinase